MVELYLGMAILLVLALLLVLKAGMHTANSAGVLQSGQLRSQQTVFRHRMQELTREREGGQLDQAQFDDLERELKRQLVAETEQSAAKVDAGQRRWPLLLVMVLLPLMAIGLYFQLGYHADLVLRDMQRQLATTEQFTPTMLADFEAQLERGLARRPGSSDHLAMLASLRRQAGDFAGAIPYYQQLLTQFPNDPQLLAQLGQARYLANDRQLDGDTRALLQRALALEPRQGTALGVLGIDAFAQHDYLTAISYWQRLMPNLTPNTTEYQVIQQGLAAARERAQAAGTLTGLTVSVALADGVSAGEQATLFVVARSNDGNPMPVAAQRLQVSAGQWPVRVLLTGLDIIRPGSDASAKLVDFAPLSLSAHISVSGTAKLGEGDWLAEPQTLSAELLAQPQAQIELLIQHQVGSSGDSPDNP